MLIFALWEDHDVRKVVASRFHKGSQADRRLQSPIVAALARAMQIEDDGPVHVRRIVLRNIDDIFVVARHVMKDAIEKARRLRCGGRLGSWRPEIHLRARNRGKTGSQSAGQHQCHKESACGSKMLHAVHRTLPLNSGSLKHRGEHPSRRTEVRSRPVADPNFPPASHRADGSVAIIGAAGSGARVQKQGGAPCENGAEASAAVTDGRGGRNSETDQRKRGG